MAFLENTQQLTLFDNMDFFGCKNYFDDLLEEPLLETENHFLITNSIQDFNNNNNTDYNNYPDGYSNYIYNHSNGQTQNLMGDDIFDNTDYIFNDLGSNKTLNSPASYSNGTPSKESNDSIFSNGSMLTLSSHLTFEDDGKDKSTTKNDISSNIETECPTTILTTDNNINIFSPYSSVVSSPETIQKNNELCKNINVNLLFNIDPLTINNTNCNIKKQEGELTGLNSINKNPKENHWVKVDRVKRIRRVNNNNNTNKHVSKLQHPKTGKKIADSRLSVAALAEVLKVDSLEEALTTERYILDIFENELHYPLGYKTWIRDTPKCERERLINQLYERTKHKYPNYDKSILETIIRRSTYSMMQSRLRKERKKNRKLAQSMRSTVGKDINFQLISDKNDCIGNNEVNI